MSRVLSIDVMRGAALVGMVIVHFVVYYGDHSATGTWPYFLVNHALGDWGAAAFLMLMGMSQVLSAEKRSGGPALELKRALVRGGFLFLVGLLMLAVTWGPARIWQWDILTMMGTMTVVVFFCRFAPSVLLIAGSLVIALASPWLRRNVDFEAAWGGPFIQVPVISDAFPGILLDPSGAFQVIWTVPDVVRGFLFAGEFPLFPWALFPVVGVVIGRRVVRGRIAGDLPLLAIIGGLLVCLGLGGAWASLLRPSSVVRDFLSPLSIYPDSFTMIAVQLGMSLLVFTGFSAWFDRPGRDPAKAGPVVRACSRASRSSLTFYFLHYLLLGWPLAIVHLFRGRPAVAALLGVWPSLAAGLAAVVLLQGLLVVWERRQGRFSLEWWLAALSPASPSASGSAQRL